jgi:hypothetical protein
MPGRWKTRLGLPSRFKRRHEQPIDAQLKIDLEAGRIDDRIKRALDDDQAGRTQPL